MADGDIGVPGGSSYHSTSATNIPNGSSGDGGVAGSGDGHADDSVKATAPLESVAAQVGGYDVVECIQQCQINASCLH